MNLMKSQRSGGEISDADNDLARTVVDCLKKMCPLPDLLGHLGLAHCAVPSCKSPLRDDTNPSFGVFQRDDKWFWKDHGANHSGDELSFLARWFDLDTSKDFSTLLKIYRRYAITNPAKRQLSLPKRREKPDRTGFVPGTPSQLQQLSTLRNISLEALELAQERGFLLFGQWCSQSVFAVTDRSECILELRRLDGEMFPAYGTLQERKSHAPQGSQKKWPVGILEAEAFKNILLIEGVPDFLAAHQIILTESAVESVAPVAMLGASCEISAEALSYFAGKHVRIVPHLDLAGLGAAARWQTQLAACGATVDFCDLAMFNQGKDLCDVNPFHATQYSPTSAQWRILP